MNKQQLKDFSKFVSEVRESVLVKITESYEDCDKEEVYRFVSLFLKEMAFTDHSISKVLKSIVGEYVEISIKATNFYVGDDVDDDTNGTTSSLQEMQHKAKHLLFIIDIIYNTVLDLQGRK